MEYHVLLFSIVKFLKIYKFFSSLSLSLYIYIYIYIYIVAYKLSFLYKQSEDTESMAEVKNYLHTK